MKTPVVAHIPTISSAVVSFKEMVHMEDYRDNVQTPFLAVSFEALNEVSVI
jgi:hypothetical protein